MDGFSVRMAANNANVSVSPAGRVSYHFSIPVGRPVGRSVRFWFFDPSIFTAFDVKAANARLSGAPPGTVIRESRDPDMLRIVASFP